MSETARSESFEQTLERLETLVKTMEAGGKPLEEMLHLYEEGISLSHKLRGQLKDAQGKLEELGRGGDAPEAEQIGMDG